MSDAECLTPVSLEYTEIVPSNVDTSKNPILYLHTIGNSKELWPQHVQVIARQTNRRSFMLDLRCHGDSAHAAKFTLDLIVQDLFKFMESKRISKAFLVGHGFGGIAVCLFALRHPEKVEMLVNVDGALKNEVIKDTSSSALKYVELWATAIRNADRNLPVDQVVQQAYDYVYQNFPETASLEPRDTFYTYIHPIRKVNQYYDVKHNVETIAKFLRKAARHKVLNLRGKFDGPALFMMGSDSNAKSGLRDAINGIFPRGRIEIFVGATHHIHLLFPQRFAEVLVAFHDNPRNASF